MTTNGNDVHLSTPTWEADVDLLLMEELYCSPEFRQWFYQHVFATDFEAGDLVEVSRGLVDTYGEADLLLIVADASGTKRACLIEDKITAPLQPSQPERYYQRGQAGIETKRWHEFRTCLVAPRAYVSPATQARFDATLTYESLIDWFANTDGTREHFRARFIKLAIAKRLSASGLLDEAAYFLAMERKEPAAISHARSLLDWAQSSRAFEVSWTTDAFRFQFQKTSCVLCSTQGSVSIPFSALRKTKAFEGDHAREQLRDKLNTIRSVSLRSSEGTYEGFLIKEFSEEELVYLKQLLSWVAASLKTGAAVSAPPSRS